MFTRTQSRNMRRAVQENSATWIYHNLRKIVRSADLQSTMGLTLMVMNPPAEWCPASTASRQRDDFPPVGKSTT
jgi:hypothetical protein